MCMCTRVTMIMVGPWPLTASVQPEVTLVMLATPVTPQVQNMYQDACTTQASGTGNLKAPCLSVRLRSIHSLLHLCQCSVAVAVRGGRLLSAWRLGVRLFQVVCLLPVLVSESGADSITPDDFARVCAAHGLLRTKGAVGRLQSTLGPLQLASASAEAPDEPKDRAEVFAALRDT